ncbi:MAG: phosphodiester glycosidase family protein [Planctomycetota bacterium]|nr:phosphodiester glycosidase family protein [Planctomycetota bacterium]
MRLSRILSAAAALMASAWACAQPLRIQPIERTTSGGTVRGYVGVVDLLSPGVDVVVTDPLPGGSGVEANLVRTDTWRSTTGVNLAVNANYFGTLTATTADIIGLSISNGVLVSPVRQFGDNPDPSIIFRTNGTAAIGYFSPTQLAGVTEAVAGVGPSTTDTVPGTMLVVDGVNTGSTCRVEPTVRNPRTAVGINQSGTQLYIVVIDGRQTGWSVGMTLPELANFMIERGAYRAINLDGGGSSSFVYQASPGSTVISNRPSDGAHRAVANHLGIRIPAQTAALDPRPIRGVWLRPPSTISALETNLAQFAAARVTDLYLETFYHGLSTGASGQFAARFSINYLDQAIKAAAKYNIRVHAWCESGYWQFGTTGQANFVANPEWRSFNVSTNDVGGDGTAGQVFANLTNPGVQAKMRAYFAELAGYAGLWGIQTDYHRFALDNNTADSFSVPWSYDTWTRSTFQTLYGSDPVTTAATTAGARWLDFLSWRRAGISAAAREMHEGINSVHSGIEFSAAMFATSMSSSAQIAKCQDWYSWCTNNWIETLVPMAYGSTTASIQTDIDLVKTFAAGKRVVAGLAITGTSTHPAIADQLNTIKSSGVESFVFFDGTAFTTVANQFALSSWVLNTATVQKGDFNIDGYVDIRDRVLLNGIYSGTPVTVNAANRKYDLDGNNTINAADVTLFVRYFAKFRFGEDEVVDQRDIDAVRACFGATAPVAGIQHLYDLDGDGDVDYADQVVLHGLLTTVVTPDYDVDRNGRINIDDLYNQWRSPIDVNRSGTIDDLDAVVLESLLRESESADLASPRP